MSKEPTRREVFLVRHAPTAANVASVFQGHLDVPALVLDEQRVPPLPRHGRRRIFSSPLGRALTAAAALFPGEPVIKDQRLIERSAGLWEGLSHQQVRHGWPAYVKDGQIDLVRTPPGGESISALLDRCWRFLTDVDDDQQAFIVTHNGWARAAMLLTGSISAAELFAAEVPFLTALPLRMENVRHPADVWPRAAAEPQR